jgi:type I restriction enzyme S subunit
MLPEGWAIKSLADIVKEKISYGIVQAGPHVAEGIPYIKSSDLRGILQPQKLQRTSPEIHYKYRRSAVHPGDIVYSLRGNIGVSAIVPENLPEANLTQGTARISVAKDQCNLFHYYQLASLPLLNRVNALSKGSTFKEISLEELRKVKVHIPRLPEQKKIAQILSTWDQAITATERLLESSQQRKKGLMQQLLTGKKRLPGFEGEWKKIELGDAVKYQQPTPFLVNSTEYSDEFPTPVLTAGKSFILGYTDEDFGIYDDGLPVIIFDDFTTASRFVSFPFKVKSSAIKILTVKSEFSIQYIFEAMQMIRFAIGGHQRHWISVFSNLVVPCPSLEEQQAISRVFFTADNEISVVKNRLNLLKKEKKALMQQLLIGKRRVKVEAA